MMTSFAQRAKKMNMSQVGKQATESRMTREKNWDAAELVQKGEYHALPVAQDSGIEPVYEEVDMNLVFENPYNAREIYDLDRIERLAASIKLDGQLVPAIGVKRGSRYLLIAGHYRFKALRRGEAKSIKMMVYPEHAVNDQKIYEFSFKENEERSEQTVMDNAIAWQRVLDSGIYTSTTALSEAISVSQSNITKTLSILSLPDSVLDVIKDEPSSFGLSLVYELQRYAKLAPEIKAVEMAVMIKNKDITRKDIMAAREAITEKKPDEGKRKNQMSRSYSLRYNAGEGNIKEWDGGKVQVDLNFNDDEEKERFLEYIQGYSAAN